MTIEELEQMGWKMIFSGVCTITSWGEHVVHLHHSAGRRVSGYGDTEEDALQDASKMINESRQEISMNFKSYGTKANTPRRMARKVMRRSVFVANKKMGKAQRKAARLARREAEQVEE